MHISLEQAIEIHARALVRKLCERAPLNARRYAAAKQECGDASGHEVWLAVALAAERMIAAAPWDATAAPARPLEGEP